VGNVALLSVQDLGGVGSRGSRLADGWQITLARPVPTACRPYQRAGKNVGPSDFGKGLDTMSANDSELRLRVFSELCWTPTTTVQSRAREVFATTGVWVRNSG